MEVRQISIFLENRPGQLAGVTSRLFRSGINLLAVNVAETEDYGVLRMIADDTDAAVDVLHENGYITLVNPVVCVQVPDVPGGLCRVLDVIAAENVDIEYMFSINTHVNGHACMIFKSKTPGQIVKVFEENGIETVDSGNLGIR